VISATAAKGEATTVRQASGTEALRGSVLIEGDISGIVGFTFVVLCSSARISSASFMLLQRLTTMTRRGARHVDWTIFGQTAGSLHIPRTNGDTSAGEVVTEMHFPWDVGCCAQLLEGVQEAFASCKSAVSILR